MENYVVYVRKPSRPSSDLLVEYDPIVEDDISCVDHHHNRMVQGFCIDSCLLKKRIPSSDGFFFVYSIIDRSSFNAHESMLNSLFEVMGTTEVPIVILGTKCDLDSERQVLGLIFFFIPFRVGGHI